MAFFGNKNESAQNDADEQLSNRDSIAASRTPVDRQDRKVSQDRNVTDMVRGAERRALLRDTNTLLPHPPVVDGYHSFWATTTNPKDTVESRMRLGYTFITRDEAPDFEFSSLKDGESSNDRIMVNEMVAMKIPLDLWKEDMMEMHHNLPKERLEDLKNSVRTMEDGRGNKIHYTGGEFNNGRTEGFNMLGKVLPPTLNGVA